jgi:adenine/guanine phosphoribosyltransferase-like PRPP-binding protein
VIAPANQIPLDANQFDTAFSTQTIEHVGDCQGLVNEAFRLLKPGGYFIVSGPMYWPLHEEPYDFYRFTKHGFKHLFDQAGFQTVEIIPNGGKWALLGQVIFHTLPSWLLLPKIFKIIIFCDQIIQFLNDLRRFLFRIFFQNFSVPENIIKHNKSTWSYELGQQIKVVRIIWLVCIDIGEIRRRKCLDTRAHARGLKAHCKVRVVVHQIGEGAFTWLGCNGRGVALSLAMGRELARESTLAADVVVPIPDSGVPAALGFAQETGIPFELGIIRNHYVGRTFIEPTQTIRSLGVKLKHNANRAAVRDKRVVLVDDSIVRGTTSVKIVRMMYEAGAREVHMRISSPPIKHPDFYGIDTPEQKALLAATHSLEEMRDYIGVTSLAFLSVDGIYRAMGYPGRDNARPQFTDHCFTGDYPTHLTDLAGENRKQQLSLLAEAG